MTTTIQISDELWEELNKKKERGETFEDVIWKLINIQLNKQEVNKNARTTNKRTNEHTNIHRSR